MPQDAYTLKYLCKELNTLLKGGKVNRITEPTLDDVILTVWTGKATKRLHLNVNPTSTRIGITDKELESPLTAPNFCMLLRKHLLNATLNQISLVGFDRIVKIDFTTGGEFFDGEEKTLYVELMGRYSNIILTEKGKILGGNRGVNMFDNGVRPLIVGTPYKLPPAQNKLEPNDKNLVKIFNEYSNNGFAEYLLENVQGFAKSTALEFEKIVEKSANKNDFGESVFALLQEFINDIKVKPCVKKIGEEIVDFSVFPYEIEKGENIIFESLINAENEYYESRFNARKIKETANRINGVLSGAIKKAKKRLSAILLKEKSAEDCKNNQVYGELILANIYRLKGGENSIIVDNYYDGTKVEIPLDEKLSPSQNAENYFKKYTKQKRTILALAPQKQKALEEVNYLDSVKDEFELCISLDDYIFIIEELKEYGLIKKENDKKKRKVESKPFREYFIDGFRVKAGRNNAENDRLTGTAKSSDIWVHAKDFHSSHIIIETEGKTVPDSVLVKACEICAYYSKGRNGGKTEIVYALKKFVKKPPKSPLGFCTYDNFKSVMCNPNAHAEFLKTR